MRVSKTIRGAKGPGYDYWTSRHPTLTRPGRYTKTQTHRHERREAKKELEEQREKDFIDTREGCSS